MWTRPTAPSALVQVVSFKLLRGNLCSGTGPRIAGSPRRGLLVFSMQTTQMP